MLLFATNFFLMVTPMRPSIFLSCDLMDKTLRNGYDGCLRYEASLRKSIEI